MTNTRKGFKLTPTDKDKRIEELKQQIEKMKVDIKQEQSYKLNSLIQYNDELCDSVEKQSFKICTLENKITKLEQQIEKLIDFVLSKTECCDVCPETDTCINSEGTCPYAGILAKKGEEDVTREWLMQFISRR